MSKIKLRQIKSPIGRKAFQKKILISLGLNKINRIKEHNDNPALRGMIEKVKHLIVIE